jgi:dihydropyrimidine dehydrogenase (NAD+) subunit PreA
MSTRNPLETEMCGIKMKNPILVASGPPTNDAEFMRLAFESGASGVVTKTLTDVELLRESLIRPKFTILQKKRYPHCFSNYSTGGLSCYTPDEFVREVKEAKKYAIENDGVLVGSISTSTSLQMWKDLAKMDDGRSRNRHAGAQFWMPQSDGNKGRIRNGKGSRWRR